MLARPLHLSKVGQSKEKGKTKKATLISDFHEHGSKRSLWPIRLARSSHRWPHNPSFPRFEDKYHTEGVQTQPGRTCFTWIRAYAYCTLQQIAVFSTLRRVKILHYMVLPFCSKTFCKQFVTCFVITGLVFENEHSETQIANINTRKL